MTVERTMMAGVCVLTPKRNLTGGDETRALTTAVDDATNDGATKVVVDLGRISWVNSMGLASLQRARLTCVDRGVPFVMACVGGRIKNLMLTTRLVILFDTFETLEEALAAHESSNA
jgi:anti-anti-sigma factor